MGLPDILHNFLGGETLLPLIDNDVLLGCLVLEDEEIVTDFIEEAFFEPDSDPEITRMKFIRGLDMIFAIFMGGKSPFSITHNEFSELKGSNLIIHLTEDSQSIFDELLFECIPGFVERLTVEDCDDIQTSAGPVPQLGLIKLKIVRLLCVILDWIPSPSVVELLLDSKAPLVLMQMMCKYHRNSMLHN